MKRQILAFGSISGLIIIVVNTISLEAGLGHVWLGYLVMLIAFSCIFFAIKRYRDATLGGAISFGAALRLGLGISAVASLLYVAAWELYLFATDYAFLKEYAELLQSTAKDDQTATSYANPLFRLPITFLEIFPVGLVVSLVSAAILKNHRSAS